MKHGRTLQDVRKQLAKARLADGVAVQLTLRNAWNPVMWWRAFKFIYRNRTRQRKLEFLSKRSMGFDWRPSIPKKQQRNLGMLPKIS